MDRREPRRPLYYTQTAQIEPMTQAPESDWNDGCPSGGGAPEGLPKSSRAGARPGARPTCADATDRPAITIMKARTLQTSSPATRPRVICDLAQDFGVPISTAADRIQGTRLSADSPRRGVSILFREPWSTWSASRPSAGAGRDGADPEGAPAPPNRGPSHCSV